MTCPIFFVSDMHGSASRYRTLIETTMAERPRALLLGGDLLPGFGGMAGFFTDILEPGFRRLREALGSAFPKVLLIPGNDDAAADFTAFGRGEAEGLWQVIHRRSASVGGHPVFGYGCVPPTPFLLKDWERYDVSRYTDPGSVSPEEGQRTVAVDADDVRYGTIAGDLAELAGDADLSRSVWLFHAPPYRTALDRAGLDGRFVDHVPLDVNVGSIAVKRFIEERQPLLTLHGHVHESASRTGAWRESLGRTWMLSAAHGGPELALVRVDLSRPGEATRELISAPTK